MRPVLPLLLASLARREAPQELSHDRYILTVKQMLDLNNTIGVVDPTFGLLGNSQAVAGIETVMDANCLQLVIADCAFTNAKSANNLEGLVSSLIYRALERNTAGVGIASEQCTAYTPLNKELSKFRQHQDPASPGALANNKATALELARQIALIGGDPTDALFSGTFQPGDISSTDVVGNACNTADCIFSGDTLVRDASEAEIYDYVGSCVETITSTIGASGSAPTVYDQSNSLTKTVSGITSAPSAHLSTASPTTTSRAATTDQQATAITTTTQQQQQTSTPAASTSSTAAANTSTPAASTSTNLQTFTQAYLDVAAPAVTQDSAGVFHVDGDSSKFSTSTQALGRSCDIQKNACANKANENKDAVGPCDTQLTACKQATNSGP